MSKHGLERLSHVNSFKAPRQTYITNNLEVLIDSSYIDCPRQCTLPEYYQKCWRLSVVVIEWDLNSRVPVEIWHFPGLKAADHQSLPESVPPAIYGAEEVGGK